MIALARWLVRHELRAARLEAENAMLQLTVLRAMYAALLREQDAGRAAKGVEQAPIRWFTRPRMGRN